MNDKAIETMDAYLSRSVGHTAALTLAMKAVVGALPDQARADFAKLFLAFTNSRLLEADHGRPQAMDDATREVTATLLRIATLPYGD